MLLDPTKVCSGSELEENQHPDLLPLCPTWPMFMDGLSALGVKKLVTNPRSEQTGSAMRGRCGHANQLVVRTSSR